MSSLSKMNVVPKGKHSGTKSMEGMPGHINAHVKGDDRILKGKGFGPHAEGSIGQKGHGNNEGKIYGSASAGSMTKDYKADSTGPAGTYKQMNPGHPPQGPRVKIGGGHPGRMENITGKATTKAEGRRKTHMY